MAKKDANAFIAKNFILVKSQREELESDLKQNDFLKVHKKHPSYKAQFDFRTKMHAQSKIQRALIIPFLMATDKAVKARILVDEVLQDCGAAVIDDDDPKAVFTGLGN